MQSCVMKLFNSWQSLKWGTKMTGLSLESVLFCPMNVPC